MRRSNLSIANQLVFGVEGENGATVDAYSYDESHAGYAVGGRDPGLVVTDFENSDRHDMRQRVAAWVAGTNASTYGSWRDETPGGHVYFDTVDIIDDRDAALELARQRHEKAIYDLAKGEEVPA